MTNQPSGSAKAWKLLEDNRFPLSGDCYGLHMREVDAEKLALAIDAAIEEAVAEKEAEHLRAIERVMESSRRLGLRADAIADELQARIAELEGALVEFLSGDCYGTPIGTLERMRSAMQGGRGDG